MLTMRFDIGAPHRAFAVDALTARILPPLALRVGIAGVHLCLADEDISKLETAEKKARADKTLVPMWIALIEGVGVDEVRAVADELAPALEQHHARAIETAIYRHEFTRLKTPQSAG